MKRVYVMDCGGFVKIGVSSRPDVRKEEIPYKVAQYYCTKPLENGYEVERRMHNFFSSNRNVLANGREYFNVKFEVAVKKLAQLVNNIEVNDLYIELLDEINARRKVPLGSKQENSLQKLCNVLPNLDNAKKIQLLGIAQGMAMVRESEENDRKE